MKLLLWLVKLYPRAWRERYENEMVALLEEHTITLFTGIDLLFGALDARLDPHYRTQLSLNDRMSRIRFANSTILCIIPLFWICWQAFLGDMSNFIVNRLDPTVEITSMLFRIAFKVTIWVVLVSGLWVSVTAARRITSKRNTIIRFLPPAYSLFVFISYCLMVNNGPTNALVFTSELLVGLLLTSIIVAKGKISKQSLLPSFVLTAIATLGMIAQLIDIAYWSVPIVRFRNTITVYSASAPKVVHAQSHRSFIDSIAGLSYKSHYVLKLVIHAWSYTDKITLLSIGLGSMALLTLVAVFVLVRGLLALITARKAAQKEEMLQTMPPLIQ